MPQDTPSSTEITKVLVDAFKTGHAWNPAYPNLQNLDMTSVLKMDGNEQDAKDLIASRQASDLNANILVAAFHGGRKIQYDGDIGPATLALVDVKRCPIPDFPPPPNASFHYDDPELQAVVESQQAAAAFVGSYWKGCDPNHKDIHSLVIGIDIRNAGSNFKANQERILAARKAIAAEIGVHVKFVINPESMAGLQQYQVYRNIPGGVIGRNYFPSANSCGKIPNGDMDSSYDPGDWELHVGLGTHESEGHGFGFNHTRGGIMNPSIIKTPLTWKNDAAWSQVKRYYPGEPLDIGTPPPPPPPSSDVVVSRWTDEGRNYEVVRKGGTKPPPIVIEV
jgi:hypothetical protein